MTYSQTSSLRKNLSAFLTVIGLLIVVGFIFIYSSSSVYALEKFGKPHFYLVKQIMGFILGLVGFFICRYFPLNKMKVLAPYAFFGSVFLTVLTLVPGFGVKIHGSQRWVSLAGITFQPSEFLKITIILYLAYILTKKRYFLSSFFYAYLPFLIILGITAVTLLKQPDFGQAVTICSMAFILFFIAKIKPKHLLLTLIPLIPVVSLLVYMKPYRFNRILVFLNPWADAKGAGYQIIQSLVAIGSGGFWGVGIANSKQKFFYLPMQHTDFIFSIIAEETGFVGILLLILLYVLFLYFGLKIASQLNDQFSSYLVLGFVLLISIQALVNMAVVTSLLPTKGIGLPFVSYGSSSLFSSLCLLGIIVNCVYNEEF